MDDCKKEENIEDVKKTKKFKRHMVYSKELNTHINVYVI